MLFITDVLPVAFIFIDKRVWIKRKHSDCLHLMFFFCFSFVPTQHAVSLSFKSDAIHNVYTCSFDKIIHHFKHISYI